MKIIGLSNIKYELDKLEDIPHILLTGARGTGKSTTAKYIANKNNRHLIFVTGNTIKKQDLLNIFVSIEEGNVLLIDEIHRLRPDTEELLYQPMENFQLPLKDVSGKFHLYKLPKFSVIGTTTKIFKISKPLLSRFQLVLKISHYSIKDLAKIILVNYPQLKRKDAILIASYAVTPREAINLAFRVLNLKTDTNKALQILGYKYGLSKDERFYLKIVYNIGKISLNSLASSMQLDTDEIKYIEDNLIKKGYIEISNKGRQLTYKGMLKIKEISK